MPDVAHIVVTLPEEDDTLACTFQAIGPALPETYWSASRARSRG
jgi:hypothetical protein